EGLEWAVDERGVVEPPAIGLMPEIGHARPPYGLTTAYPAMLRGWMRVRRPPEFASNTSQVFPAMCCLSTNTCPRRAATMPDAGATRGKRSQLAARLSAGMIRPKTCSDAPQPQNRAGQPVGRPPSTVTAPRLTSWPKPPASVSGATKPGRGRGTG